MSFVHSTNGPTPLLGTGKRISWGLITTNSSTGGDVKTGLKKVEAIQGPKITAVSISAGTATITTASGALGGWLAIGD